MDRIHRIDKIRTNYGSFLVFDSARKNGAVTGAVFAREGKRDSS
jgi:hypothetical protein